MYLVTRPVPDPAFDRDRALRGGSEQGAEREDDRAPGGQRSHPHQVKATNSISFCFLSEIFYLPGDKSMTSSRGNAILFLPATPLSLLRTLEGLFDLTRHPSRALDSPRALLP